MPLEERQRRLSLLTAAEREALPFRWSFWARPAQLWPDGGWRTWFIKAGRGFGKTRAGAEAIRSRVENGRYGHITLVGATAADVRDIMVEGESGLKAISPPWFYPYYQPSKRQITWPNGAVAKCYSAEEPDSLRGPQSDLTWCDEPAKWKYATLAWDNLQFGLRLGSDPRNVVTGTPKNTSMVKQVLKAATTVVTGGSTYENRANLSPAFIEEVVVPYEGTRLGRQELHAELLEDVPGALWKLSTMIEPFRRPQPDDLLRIVVAVDPAVTSGESSNETGIIVAGLRIEHDRGAERTHGYVLEDCSLKATPAEWAHSAVQAYHRWQADLIVGEVNNGGDLVESNLRAARDGREVPYHAVHASRGKQVRAEPISTIYEQGRVHHRSGPGLEKLEDQLCETDFSVPRDPEKSPDRLDALVWALTELMLTEPDTDLSFYQKLYTL